MPRAIQVKGQVDLPPLGVAFENGQLAEWDTSPTTQRTLFGFDVGHTGA